MLEISIDTMISRLHFTELVLRSFPMTSLTLVCQVRICSKGVKMPGEADLWPGPDGGGPAAALVVCNFAPPGNYEGQKPYR